MAQIHQFELMKQLAKAFLKNFTVGVCWGCAEKGFSIMRKSNGSFKSKLMSLLSSENISLCRQRGLLLGCWVVQFKLLAKIVQKLRGKKNNCHELRPHPRRDESLQLALLAFLAGTNSVGMFGGMSLSFALYLFCRAVRGVSDVAYEEHWFPGWYEKLPTWLLYAVFIAPWCSHCLLFKPQYVPRGYLNMMANPVGLNVHRLKYMFGNGSLSAMTRSIPNCQPHYHKGLCVNNALYRFSTCFRVFSMAYVLIFLPRILLKPSRLRTPLITIPKFFKSVVSTSMIGVCCAWGSLILPCVFRKYNIALNSMTVCIACCIMSCSFAFEAPKRRRETMVWNISITLHSILNWYLGLEGHLSDDVFARRLSAVLFGLSSAFWVWSRIRSNTALTRNERAVLKFLFPLDDGEKLNEVAVDE